MMGTLHCQNAALVSSAGLWLLYYRPGLEGQLAVEGEGRVCGFEGLRMSEYLLGFGCAF